MAIPSTMLALGTKAPDFELPDVVTGTTVSIRDFDGKRALLVMFICRHCPYVKHVRARARAAGARLRRLRVSRSWRSARTIRTSTPRTRPRAWRKTLERPATPSRTCSTRPRRSRKAYTAACTPDLFLFDADRALVYRGQLDDSRPSNGLRSPARTSRAAIDAVLSGGRGLAGPAREHRLRHQVARGQRAARTPEFSGSLAERGERRPAARARTPSQRSSASRAAGHSVSTSENHALSRFRPRTIMCARNTPRT